jgi:hypothetical protein
MFVSSVDVEERLGYGNKAKGNKQKQKHSSYNEEKRQPSAEVWMDPGSFYADADDPNVITPNHGPNTSDAPSYETAEHTWSIYPKVTAPEQLSEVGRVVGWWALGINPTTYTPENLLSLARLVSSYPFSSADPTIIVKLIPRPVEKQNGMISFGRHAHEVEAELGEGQDEVDVCEYKWADILAGDWKLVHV